MYLETSAKPFSPLSYWLLLGFIFLLGIALRAIPSAGFPGTGFDERLYRNYVTALDLHGFAGYPKVCQDYIDDQRKPENITKLPPTRFLYIFAAQIWKRFEFSNAPPLPQSARDSVNRDPALVSLHRVACLFSCFLLILTVVMVRRMFDIQMQLGVSALVAFSPLLVQMSQHALIDGFFAFFAMLCLWLLWENLSRPGDWRWLLAYGGALFLLVLTKENSFFVYISLCCLMVANKWAKFGIVGWKLCLVSIVGPALAVLLLISLAGGLTPFITIYQLLVTKASHLEFAIKTGDGPWYRYLIDLMLVSPIVLCLAIGGFFTQSASRRSILYMVLFMVFSYALMCNIPYAMNLRYATIWDLTLRILAMAQLLVLASTFGRRQGLFIFVATVALCAYDLNQYVIFFVDGKIYEPITSGLLWCVKILK